MNLWERAFHQKNYQRVGYFKAKEKNSLSFQRKTAVLKSKLLEDIE